MRDDVAPGRRLPGGLRLQAGEGSLLLVMASLCACLLAGYTIAKVLRDSMFIAAYGALALPVGYVAVVIASIAIVWIEPMLTRRLSRAAAVAVAQSLAIAASAAAALCYPFGGHWLAGVFYVWAGSQAIMLIPYFWVVALDVWDSQRARDVFPLLSAAGLVGGVLGGAFATWGAHRLGAHGLLWALVATLVVARILSIGLDRRLPSRPYASQTDTGKSRLAIVLESPYLQLLGVTLMLSVMAGTLIDFQFKYAAQRTFGDPEGLTRFLGLFYAGLNALALVMQIGVAGWLFKRMGLFVSSAIQPFAVLVLSSVLLVMPRWGFILALRWSQGVLSQTLGKSASEMYFQAMRAPERERVKPALDTLIERGADGLVGVLLIVALHSFGMNVAIAAGMTGVIALAWLVAVVVLRRRYVRAFRQALSGPPTGAAIVAGIPGDPESRRVLVQALLSDDDHQVELALRMARHVRRRDVIEAVRACLERESPRVRAAAIEALAALRAPDTAGAIDRQLGDPEERVRRAVVDYLLATSSAPAGLARKLLDSEDRPLRLIVLDALVARPRAARGVVGLEWVDRRIAAGGSEDAIEAALALALVPGPEGSARLRGLLEHSDAEVRRAALRAAAARPDLTLLGPIGQALGDDELFAEAREAVAALGDAALPELRRVVREGDPHARYVVCQALARLGTDRAVRLLLELARSPEPETRYDALRNLNRIKQRTTARLVPRAHAHRMFLRELADYRLQLEPAIALEGTDEPTVRLLQASYFESTDRALERACRALACAYNPEPFRAIYARLSDSPSGKQAAQALEYLSHLLPPKVFGAARRVLEVSATPEEGAAAPSPGPEQITRAIDFAWRKGDDWLRACAVATARAWPALAIRLEPRADESQLVLAELRLGPTPPARGRGAGAPAC